MVRAGAASRTIGAVCSFSRFAERVMYPLNAASSLHIVGNPILCHGDRRFRGVPAVDAVILTCSEVVFLAPLDRSAAQVLRVDLHVLHCRADLRGVGRPATGL